VFVSSLITDMPQERAAVRSAVKAVGAIPVMFEDLGAQDVSAEQAYLVGVRSSDLYIGIWGPRYGVRMPDGYSATHAEFLEAERHGLRLCLFVGGEGGVEMDGPQRDLISSARNLYTTSPWSDPSDLEHRVQRRLEALAAEELAPWVRVGRTLFRAQQITNDGQKIMINAAVQNDAVHAELVQLRDRRTSEVSFASPNAAHKVQVSELSTRTTSTIGHEETLTLAIREQRGINMRSSINGVSADEVTRRALADGLFGTSSLGQQAGWLTRPIDPLQPLRELALDDFVLRPVARLLFAEHLLEHGLASRLEAFALGPAHRGDRRLHATWTPPRLYANEPEPSPISIDGIVSGL
jgi:hypothetical protein